MPVSALLRFGPIGTLILVALPFCFAARYLLSHQLVQYTVETRQLEDDEHALLETLFEEVGLPVAEVIVVTNVDTPAAGLTGTPRNRLVLLSETTLETTTKEELKGLAGIAAGKHESRVPELYADYLVVASAAVAILLGVDPSGLPSPLMPVLVVVGLLVIVGLGHQALRRRIYAADQEAVRRVGRNPVEAALEITSTRRLPEWIPDVVHPKPSEDRRRNEL